MGIIASYSNSHHSDGWIFWILITVIIIAFINSYIKSGIEKNKRVIKELELEIAKKNEDIKALQELIDTTLKDWRKFGAMLPSLREWSDKVRSEYDAIIERGLRKKSRPAYKAAEEVKEARTKARESKKEAERLAAKLAIYESQAPWLAEYTDYSVDEIIQGIEEEEDLKELYKSGGDPVSLFVSKDEWNKLSAAERNQKALDRYWSGSRKKTAWTAGIQYERFIGYQYESNGFKVTYQGAIEGKEDLGIDLICSKDGYIHIVQCKRLSEAKAMPVRENVIAQVYGASVFYAMEAGLSTTPLPVLFTTYECSDQARKFAKHLGVHLSERVLLREYPCIKCNISRSTGDKIYHLPFDQQYDKTNIGDSKGDFYAATIAEAESKGFRRAFRWRGN